MKFATTENRTHRPSQIEKGEYYCLTCESASNAPLVIVGGGREHCHSEYQLEGDSFPYFTLEYIASGTCQFERDGITQTLSTGSLYSYTPNSSVKIVNTGGVPLIKYFINFRGPQASEIVDNPILKGPSVKNLGHLQWVESVFLSLQESGVAGLGDCHSACSHLLQYLTARLEESCILRKDNHSTTPSLVSFENIRSYIEANYASITSPQEVAKSCNVSHQYLCRLFKRFTNETPTQMITRLKLLKSADLLKSRTLLVKQVAEKVGFDDQYYFSKCFKDFYGLSPRNYLKVDPARISA